MTIIDELNKVFPEEHILTSTADRIAYSYDNSKLQAIPQAVVFATEHDQIVSLVKLCRKYQTPLTARGAGTGTTGATVPLENGIVVSFEKMDKILEINAANRFTRVQPGVRNNDLQMALAEQGFFWPPDPTSAAVCTIGGNLAYNSAGPRAVKYGTPRENTLGLTAVSGEGTTLHTGALTTKAVVGYDLTRLLIGSEGTLGIITEAVLKLTPLQPLKYTIKAVYKDIQSATQVVSAIMAQPVVPCALEFMDHAAIRLIKDNPALGLTDEAAAILMIEVDGREQNIDADLEQIVKVADTPNCMSIETANTKEEADRLWSARKSLSPALRNLAPNKINEDVVVPVANIPKLIEGLRTLSTDFDIDIVNFGHAGNGNIHVNLMYDPANQHQNQHINACLSAVFDLVLNLGGSLSGEHGIGLVKNRYVSREIESPTLDLMQKIRLQFDPDSILNPGKTLPDELGSDV